MMKASSRPHVVLSAVVLMAALQACGSSPKGQYIASATQPRVVPEEAAAQAAAGDPQAPSINTPDTYYRLIDRMQQEGLWFASLAHIDALEQQWGRTPQSTRLRADAMRNTDQASESGALYSQLVGTPLEGAGYHGMGLLAGSQGEYAEAIRMLEQAQRKNPTDALLLSDIGYAKLRAGRIPEARIPLMQALQLRPDSRQVQVNLALYFQASGQPEQANALMEAHGMSDATRAAIRDSAKRLSSVPPKPAQPALPAAAARVPTDDLQTPLTLRASGWSGRNASLPRGAKQAAASPPPFSSSAGASR